MYELALFAGAGGGILGGKLLGWRTVCAVEIEPYPASVLCQRQNDGILAPFPIWDDVRSFRADNPECAEVFEMLRKIRNQLVISGGFPCQDISVAGKGAGINGERSGLWSEFARIIGEVRPRFAFVENSPILTSRGLGRVLGDLVEMGYSSKWGIFSACSVGASHTRERMFIVAYTEQNYGVANGTFQTGKHREKQVWSGNSWVAIQDVETSWLLSNSLAVPKTHAMAGFVDEFAAIGNGQVPAVVRLAWETLSEGLL